MILLNQHSLNKCNSHIRFATLGPPGTSSEYVTLKLCNSMQADYKKITLFNTYEDAFNAVKKGISDVVIVANAYSKINNFYMDSDIELLATFIENTPPYGIAVRKVFNIETLKKATSIKIASHPAPTKKLDYYKDGIFEEKTFEIDLLESTSQAAKSVQDGIHDYCLTNANAVEMYDLKFISKQTDISMVWSIFGEIKILPNFVITNKKENKE